MSGCKISPVAMGMSLGIIWGVSLLVMGLVAHYYLYGEHFVSALGTLYVGYVPSIKGSILGGIIGFVDAFITGFIIAWLYNRFTCGTCCCNTKKDDMSCKK